MKIDPNDPRLTAYALGELTEAERVAFEQELTGDADARAEAGRIRNAAGILTETLDAEACPRLSVAQRQAVHERIAPAGDGEPVFSWKRFGFAAGLATVIVLLAIIFGLPAIKPSKQQAVGTTPLVPAPSTQPVTTSEYAVHLNPAPPLAEFKYAFAGGTGMPALTVNGGTLIVGVNSVGTLSGTAFQSGGVLLGDGGQLTKVGTGTLVLDGNNTYAGATSINGGTVRVTSTAPWMLNGSAYDLCGGTIVNGGTLQIGVGGAVGALTGNGAGQLDLNGYYTIGGIASYSGVLDGGSRTFEVASDPLRASGRGQLALAGKNTYTGTTIISAVTLWSGSLRHPLYSNGTNPSQSSGDETYANVADNQFYAVTDQPLSTFGLDVDTASYSNIRRFLLHNRLPPPEAVRIEEMLNYFPYDYPAPRGDEPFALYTELGECPWNPSHRLALIGLRAKDVRPREQPPLNLVFLIDVSGSMADANKLSLIKPALRLLVNQLTERDRVAIVVYASNSRVVLPSTSGDEHGRILDAINSLEANGSTNGGAGIQSAYEQASINFIEGGVNRVILCTDGDFNVGVTDDNALVRLITQKARTGVFLSVFGFGMGNLKDAKLEALADKGNGHYAYIDDLAEARKVLVEQARATLITVAKDVKLQVEFNPTRVQAYRLIGYENRVMAARDFNNDRKDAGDMGAGHTVTALYEIVPVGEYVTRPVVDELRYQPQRRREPVGPFADEWMTIKLRYKQPDADTSKLLSTVVKDTHLTWRKASDDYQFTAAVAAFGMLLRQSPNRGEATYDLAIDLANEGRGHDMKGYRGEFIELVKRAQSLAR